MQHVSDEKQAPSEVINSHSVRGSRGAGALNTATATTEPQHAGYLGSPVRRFRQRRAGGDRRPIHQQRAKAKWEQGLRLGDAVSAPRLWKVRGRSIQLGPPRALSATLHRDEHASVQIAHCTSPAQTTTTCCAGRYCAANCAVNRLIVMTPKSRCCVTRLAVSDLAGGFERGNKFPHGCSCEVDARSTRDQGDHARGVVQRQGILRPAGGARQARNRRCLPTSPSSASNNCYPFPTLDRGAKRCRKYPNAAEVVWCQEESKNQGAWYL